jgi:hypothetical protein
MPRPNCRMCEAGGKWGDLEWTGLDQLTCITFGPSFVNVPVRALTRQQVFPGVGLRESLEQRQTVDY